MADVDIAAETRTGNGTHGGVVPEVRITGITPVADWWELAVTGPDDGPGFSVECSRVAALVAVERVKDGRVLPDVIPLLVADLSNGEATYALVNHSPLRTWGEIGYFPDMDVLEGQALEIALNVASSPRRETDGHYWRVAVSTTGSLSMYGPSAENEHIQAKCEKCQAEANRNG